MQVIGVRWVGTATSKYDEMVTFLRDVLGLRTAFEELSTTEFQTADGDAVPLVMAPGDPYYTFFGRHAKGPVVLFEVDDVRVAAQELRDAGIGVGDLQTGQQLGVGPLPGARWPPVRVGQPSCLVRRHALVPWSHLEPVWIARSPLVFAGRRWAL